MIVHFNGWPGVGKLTVARALWRLCGGRLVDNHTLHNVAAATCDRGNEDYWRVFRAVRAIAYDQLRRLPAGELIIMTNALTDDDSHEREAWNEVRRLAAGRGEALAAVLLDCDPSLNAARVSGQDRRDNRKLTDPAPLLEWRASLSLIHEGADRLLQFDTGRMAPDEVAQAVAEALGLVTKAAIAEG